jgi:hypothetical protein
VSAPTDEERNMADEKQGSGTGAGPTEGTPMAMGMAMCSEMLNTIRQTNALAVFTTPELQHIFAEWLKGLEVKVEGPGAASGGTGKGTRCAGTGAPAMVAQTMGT